MEVKHYQIHTSCVIPRTSFIRLVCKISRQQQSGKDDLRWQMSALKAVQEATEIFMAKLMTGMYYILVLVWVLVNSLVAANMCALHAGCQTVGPNDIALVTKVGATMHGYSDVLAVHRINNCGSTNYKYGAVLNGNRLW
jgi:histone H3/H4